MAITILHKSTSLSKREASIFQEMVAGAADQAQRLLGPLDVQVQLEVNSWSGSEQLPVVGYAPNADEVHIAIDPAHARFEDPTWQTILAGTTGHELHHSRRWQKPGYGMALGETLVSEGLAQHFEAEIVPGYVAAYSQGLSAEQLSSLSERAVRNYNRIYFEWADWFHGDPKNPDFPRWGGYGLSYAIVGAWLKVTGQTAAQAVAVKAQEILQPWLNGELVIAEHALRHSLALPTQSLRASGKGRRPGMRA
jgi:hypothetical protein